MLVEILYFDGCPNAAETRALAERISLEFAVPPEIRMIEVSSLEAAEQLRFLGSPTVRVDGTDIEPDADSRTDFVLACRVYMLDTGYSGQPDERWLRDALSASH